jgi:predicted  nucleic acid-binding Zn-ribbon protein
MKADPQAQEQLLELPQTDHRLAQLRREVETSQLKARAKETRAAVVTAEETLVGARTQIKDLEREITRAEQDVQTVRSRVDRDQQTLDSGAATPKQMTDIQHELQSLARRQAELEDVELEIMESLEQMNSTLRDAEQAMDQARRDAQEAAAAWDRREDEIASETVALEQHRADVVAMLPADLVALYEKIRARSGLGAGLLRHARCGSCQLELSSSDLDRVRSAPADEVVRCEECGAIMVRTPESGL